MTPGFKPFTVLIYFDQPKNKVYFVKNMTCTCIQHSEEYCCGDNRLPCFIIRDDFRDLEALKPSDDAVNVRLTTPSVATMLNTDNIAFTRYKSFLLYFIFFNFEALCKFSWHPVWLMMLVNLKKTSFFCVLVKVTCKILGPFCCIMC